MQKKRIFKKYGDGLAWALKGYLKKSNFTSSDLALKPAKLDPFRF
jgi:hypothetical protein